MRRFPVLLVLAIIFFSSCAKDDDTIPPEHPQGTLQGVFIDSPVEGLKYETETHSGYTDENGNYDYEEGETVTFYVGGIKLGSASASEEMSPISIASTPDATIETLEVQNIAAFLQTLDEDGDPGNGIQISPAVADAISILEIDFTQNIIQILGEIALEVFQNTGVSLEVVYPERAAAHLAQTLGLEFAPTDMFSFNFLPAFTNYFGVERHYELWKGATRAVLWKHEFDSAGKLIKSIAYEKYPFRIFKEFYFSNYDSVNLSVDLKIQTNNYHGWPSTYTENYTIRYSSDYLITDLTTGAGVIFKRKEFEAFSSENWVTSLVSYNSEDQLVFTHNYEYDSKGNIIRTETFGIDGNLKSSNEFNYSDVDEVRTALYLNSDDSQSTFEYSYRDDHTLEKVEETFSNGNAIFYYSEEELLKEWVIFYNSGYKIVFTFEATEKVEKNFYDGVLTDIYYYRFEDGNYSGWVYKYEWYENGILRERTVLNENYKRESFEYFYDNGNLEYKEFYDQDGTRIYTEYYDENGNLINTQYHN
ncbi:toxin-antitoxin system YwqK family antitoxin [Christiangramia sediminis]|uniref:Uncharacterized protein n=1 Tax=Christiangramia sediminis TaxID=2881336 RepID=A0A9X1LG47_9FLAO|nr:hypothetical protein [Christiangramia sediminis]MCB7479724.1 hypothetical protein [Christiangramia sediminis]